LSALAPDPDAAAMFCSVHGWRCIACNCVADANAHAVHVGGYDMAVWYSKDPSTAAVGYTDWPLVKP
jgi:hypothetical protein